MIIIDYDGVPLKEVMSSRNLHICSPYALTETQSYIFLFLLLSLLLKFQELVTHIWWNEPCNICIIPVLIYEKDLLCFWCELVLTH